MFQKFFRERSRKCLKESRFEHLFNTCKELDEYVVFDTETTGLNPKKDEILSIGAVKIKGNKILTDNMLSLYLKPSKEVNIQSIKIHQIRNIDLENALEPHDGIEQFLDFIGPLPLVGYYLGFDVAMINRYIKPWLGIKLPNKQIEVSNIYHDKKIKAIPGEVIDLRFDTIMKELNLPVFGKHDAINDALMTAMIFVKLLHVNKL